MLVLTYLSENDFSPKVIVPHMWKQQSRSRRYDWFCCQIHWAGDWSSRLEFQFDDDRVVRFYGVQIWSKPIFIVSNCLGNVSIPLGSILIESSNIFLSVADIRGKQQQYVILAKQWYSVTQIKGNIVLLAFVDHPKTARVNLLATAKNKIGFFSFIPTRT